VVLPEVERAAYVLYLVKCSAAGKMESFCASARGGSNFNPAIDLHPYSQKLDRVIFENVDWRMLAERVALKPNEASLFIYADPPYTVAEARSHYRHNFRFEDHLMLARVLTRISQRNDGGRRNVKIMVSYDEDPLIRSLYRPQLGWRIDEISVGYRIAQDKKAMRHELVITNYDVPNSEVQGKS
jgi:site-specific DNA-adenine methylase